MKKIYTLGLVAFLFITGCDEAFHKTIDGNGNIVTITRNIGDAHKIKCAGHFNVELTQGSPTSLKITGDDNLLNYIITDNEDGKLVIKTKDDVNLHSDNPIKIFITTDRLDAFTLAGSGDVSGANKFTGSNNMELSMAGSGKLKFDLNCPEVKSSIAGSGDIYLTGETRNAEVNIAGAGNYHAQDLKSENSNIDIAGTGDATVFASTRLEVNIAGIGNVYYLGDPVVSQKIAGGGKIEKLK